MTTQKGRRERSGRRGDATSLRRARLSGNAAFLEGIDPSSRASISDHGRGQRTRALRCGAVLPLCSGPPGAGDVALAERTKRRWRAGRHGQGLVVLHHALLAYPGWDPWTEVTGIADRSFTYHPDQTLRVDVADGDHPITAGLASWEVTDETYIMEAPDADSHLLLTTTHPQSMAALAWTRAYHDARTFCCALGHDKKVYNDPAFVQSSSAAFTGAGACSPLPWLRSRSVRKGSHQCTDDRVERMEHSAAQAVDRIGLYEGFWSDTQQVWTSRGTFVRGNTSETTLALTSRSSGRSISPRISTRYPRWSRRRRRRSSRATATAPCCAATSCMTRPLSMWTLWSRIGAAGRSTSSRG